MAENTGLCKDRAMFKALRPLDFFVFFLSLAIIGYSLVPIFGQKNNGNAYVEIYSASRVWHYPLSEDVQIAIPGLLGESLIEIKDGSVAFIESPCPNQSCILEGSISKAGTWLACLPNAISLFVKTKKTEEVDASSW